MFCSNCGHEISEGGHFCSSCGVPVSSIPPRPANAATYEPPIETATQLAEAETAPPAIQVPGTPKPKGSGVTGLVLVALAIEIHEDWIEATRYLNMQILEEHRKLMRYKSVDAA